MDWTKLAVNIVGAAAAGYGVGGWKGALSGALLNLIGLVQQQPQPQK